MFCVHGNGWESCFPEFLRVILVYNMFGVLMGDYKPLGLQAHRTAPCPVSHLCEIHFNSTGLDLVFKCILSLALLSLSLTV